ncbi:MAG: hypothetical protein VX421_00410 [Pseudomonadota bacterium]|nr:hypothetical protein [Pseudomonadota bacterium]
MNGIHNTLVKIIHVYMHEIEFIKTASNKWFQQIYFRLFNIYKTINNPKGADYEPGFIVCNKALGQRVFMAGKQPFGRQSEYCL